MWKIIKLITLIVLSIILLSSCADKKTNFPGNSSPTPEPTPAPVPIEIFLKGEFELNPDEFKTERAFIDIGRKGAPMILELGWLSADEITPPNNEHDYFVYILSVNGEKIDPVYVEPVIEGEDAVYFWSVARALAADINGDGQNELILYFPFVNGGRGGGYITVFTYKNENFERLQTPAYLYDTMNHHKLLIEWIGEKELRISCDYPAFELNTAFLKLSYEDLTNCGSDGNWVDPVYDLKITDGKLELYQFLCIGGYHDGVGDLITALSWDENGNYVVECRFEPYG